MTNERVAQGVGLGHHVGEGPHLVLVDNERFVEPARRVEQLTKVGRCVLEGPFGDAVSFHVDHLEGTTRRAHGRVGLLKTQSHRTLLAVVKY